LSSDDLSGLIGQPDLYLIDVRTAGEYRAGAIPSALNIPYDVIQDNLPTQDRNARIVVYCRSGNRSSVAKAKLEELGFRNVNNFGAYTNWRDQLIVR
jgi:rhodanese-related sulfurtransferase